MTSRVIALRPGEVLDDPPFELAEYSFPETEESEWDETEEATALSYDEDDEETISAYLLIRAVVRGAGGYTDKQKRENLAALNTIAWHLDIDEDELQALAD